MIPSTTPKIKRLDWFHGLFGFRENDTHHNNTGDSSQSDYVRSNFHYDGETLVSKMNGAVYGVGTFSTPSLKQLRQDALEALAAKSMKRTRDNSNELQQPIGDDRSQNQQHYELLLHHIAVQDIFVLHTIQEDAQGATFMAASQANCLEFMHPNVTPEMGVTGYVRDRTQGPACALAAPAATVVRNYFVDVPITSSSLSGRSIATTRIGQTATHQLNLFHALLTALSSASSADGEKVEATSDERAGEGTRQQDVDFVVIKNGYTLSNDFKLQQLNQRIASYCPTTTTSEPREALLDLVCIGLHSHVEIPWKPPPPQYVNGNKTCFDWEVLLPREMRHHVTQAFCSALSCGYSDGSLDHWAPLARLVLDAQYEAVLWAAILEQAQNDGGLGTNDIGGSGKVYLTFLGGGVFQNRTEWIEGAIARACVTVKQRIAGFTGVNKTTLNVYLCHYGTAVDTQVVARINRLITKYETSTN